MSFFSRTRTQKKLNNELILQIDRLICEEILVTHLTKRNINYITRKNETVLMKAINNGYSEEFIKQIIARSKKIILSKMDKKGYTFLDYLMIHSQKYESILLELLKNNIPFNQNNLLFLLHKNQIYLFKKYLEKISDPNCLVKKIVKNIKDHNCAHILELNTDSEKILGIENVFEAMEDKISQNKLLFLINENHECKLQGLEYLIKNNFNDYIKTFNFDSLDILLKILILYEDLPSQKIDIVINSYKKNNHLDPQKIINHKEISMKIKNEYLNILNYEDYYNLLLNYKWNVESVMDKKIYQKIMSNSATIKLDYFIIYQTINNSIPTNYLADILAENAARIGKKVRHLLDKIISQKIKFRHIEMFLINYIKIFKDNQKFLIKVCKFIPKINFSPLSISCLLENIKTNRKTNILTSNDMRSIAGNKNYDSNVVCKLFTKFIKFKYIPQLIQYIKTMPPNIFLKMIKKYNEAKYHKLFVTILNHDQCENYLEYLKILLPYIDFNGQIYNPGIMRLKSLVNKIVVYAIYDPDFIHTFVSPRVLPLERLFSGKNHMLTLLEKYVEMLGYRKNSKLCQLVEKLIDETPEMDNHKHLDLGILISANFLPDEKIKKIIQKFKGDIIPKIYCRYGSIKIEINAMSIFQDIDTYIQNDKYLNYRWTIKYTGQSGIDGGGLIKDFYCNLGDEIKTYLEVLDHYYYINHQTKNDTTLWFKIGLLFGKMLAIDQLPCGINLHPYLLYKVTHPELVSDSNKLIDFNNSWYHDIPTIKNISKLLQLNDLEWNAYMGDYEDDENDRLKHCNSRMIELYESNYQPALNEFINGFWSIADPTKLRFIPQLLIGEKICGVLSYKILGTEYGSLEKNLNKINIDITYLKSFLSTLDEINKKDPTIIKKLYKFWMGSPYLDLEVYKPSVRYGSYKNVFQAHTCSFELVMPHYSTIPVNIYKDSHKLSSLIHTFIMNTINNQNIAEESNLHTQYS